MGKYLLLFLIFFSLRLPLAYNSVVAAAAVLSFCFFFKKNVIPFYREQWIVIFLLSLMLLLSLSWPIVFGTGDFTFSKLFISLLVTHFAIWIYVQYYAESLNFIGDAIDVLIAVFVIQSIWVIFVIVFPILQDVNAIFQDQIVYESVAYYDSKRGFALTFSPFFGVGVLYSFVLCAFLSRCATKSFGRNEYVFILIKFSLLMIGGLTSSRTFLLSVFVIIPCYVAIDYFKRRGRFTFNLFFNFLFLFSIILVGVFFSSDVLKTVLFEQILPFTFEIFYNYFDNNSFSTDSSDILLSMYKSLDLGTLIVGDGQYSYGEMYYYGDTDSGYMRPILFWGVAGFSIIIGYVIYMASVSASLVTPMDIIIIPLGLLFIFAIKGETIGYPAYINSYFIYFFYVALNVRRRNILTSKMLV